MKTSDDFITNQEWLTNAVAGTDLILRGTSALELHNLFEGYYGEKTIEVYSTKPLESENIECCILESLDCIKFTKIAGVYCTTVSQTINDMLRNDRADLQALYTALSNYYFSNNMSYDGLEIESDNLERFNEISEDAKSFYG